jgi:hypothetical protein
MVIFQIPNGPLIVALAASVTAHLTSGVVHAAASSLFYASLSIWAYEEAVNGVNWFRRLLGVAFAIYILISLTLALSGRG